MMRLKHQALSAVSATALLIAASIGLLAVGGTSVSRAEPIDPAAVSALQLAVNGPNASLASLIDQMNSEVPGSGTQFAQAFQNTDTDALADALATLAGSNAALQTTIESALTTLSQDPALASVNVATIVSSINTNLSNQFANNNNNNNNNNGNNGDNSNTLADNLQTLNPSAGPNPGQNQSPGFSNSFGNPFTTGNPNTNAGLNQGTQNNPGNQNGPGRPNSRG